MSERSSIKLDGDTDVGKSGRATSPAEEMDIRQWLAGAFTRSVKTGERLLENGNLAGAAVEFAHATLMTDRPESFVTAVRQVYPNYFYTLFKQRMLAMGYGHLFTGADVKSGGLRRSPVRVYDGHTANNKTPTQN